MNCEAAVLSLLTAPSAAAGGRLEGVVDLNRNDGALQLTELRYDLSGEYSCRAVATNGEEAAAAPWEVLILGEFRLTRLTLCCPSKLTTN